MIHTVWPGHTRPMGCVAKSCHGCPSSLISILLFCHGMVLGGQISVLASTHPGVQHCVRGIWQRISTMLRPNDSILECSSFSPPGTIVSPVVLSMITSISSAIGGLHMRCNRSEHNHGLLTSWSSGQSMTLATVGPNSSRLKPHSAKQSRCVEVTPLSST